MSSLPVLLRRGHGRALLVAAVALALTLTVLPVRTAGAAQAGWADFTFTGSSRNWSGTMQQPAAGFPEATVVSNSVGGASVGVQTGASTYLASGTAVGTKYGSSQGRPYLNLRPNNQNGAPPSVTTYTFERPTPGSGWTFVLGDIDADEVTISATDADGRPVSPSALGFRSVFNYCVSGVCTPNNDVPTWDPDTGLLRGNEAAADTNGAAAWFEPTVALSSLTFTFAQRAGFPVYQTWFSALSYDLSGTVSAPPGQQSGITVDLYDPAGNHVGQTTTDADGDYAFPGRATYDGYQVSVRRPSGLTSDDPLTRTVDLSQGDQTADFTLREVVPVAAGGTIRTPDGDPVPGVEVTLRDAGGAEVATTTTDANGEYLFDQVPVGDGWTVTATAPEGTSVTDPVTFDVPADSEEPVTDLDFVVTPVPTGSVSGLVTAQGSGALSGVTVTVTGPGGATWVATTGVDGSWRVADLPPGDYTATVTAPDGTTVVGPDSRDFVIPADGGAVTDQDFVLAVEEPATHAASGTVTGQGRPLGDVTVAVTAPDGTTTRVVTDNDGAWSVADLSPGQGYVVEIVVPDGWDVDGDARRVFDVDDADVTGLDFTLVTAATGSATPSANPSSSATPTATPTASATAASSSASRAAGAPPAIADTGGPSPMPLLGSALLLAAGVAVVLCWAAARRSVHRHRG